jgi:D-alanyl-D-alanine carboxypeptidase
MMARFADAFASLDQCLKERMDAFHNPALVMALTDPSKLFRLSSMGYVNLEAKIAIQPDHLFAIGSIGKSFTGIAALQASEAGLLDLHAPVTDYLPWFSVKSYYQPITIHHLLTHSSGLPRGTDFSPDPRSEVFALRDQEVGFAPGAHFCYSDLGYKVLGLVLEAVNGKPYAELIRAQILEPLEMNNTFAVTTNHLRPRMAVGYRHLYDDRPAHLCHPLVPAAWMETNSGDGSIVSTAEDMAKFARMLLNEGVGPHGPLISEKSYRKMIFPMIEDEGEAYSYGLYLFEDDGYCHAGHGGDVPGFESYLWLDLDNRLGTVVLMTTPYNRRASFIALEFFRQAYLGHHLPDTPPLPDFTHISNPQEYAGVYHSDQCELKLEAEDHHLFMLCGDLRVILEEREPDSFHANHPDWDLFLLKFVRSDAGKVAEVNYGPVWFTSEHYDGPNTFDIPAEWQAYAGHYRSHDPWETNFRVFSRKDQLILSMPSGEEEILVPISEGCFRISEEEYIPERMVFDQIVDGLALRVVKSSCPYYRFFTP